MLRDDLEAVLPPLYSQERLGEDAVVQVHFFNSCGTGDWWITEGSPEGNDFIMFGLCDLGFPELGYVSLDEMQAVRGPLGLGIERDLHWKPTTLREVQHGRAEGGPRRRGSRLPG
jgi:hypothetical protein